MKSIKKRVSLMEMLFKHWYLLHPGVAAWCLQRQQRRGRGHQSSLPETHSSKRVQLIISNAVDELISYGMHDNKHLSNFERSLVCWNHFTGLLTEKCFLFNLMMEGKLLLLCCNLLIIPRNQSFVECFQKSNHNDRCIP